MRSGEIILNKKETTVKQIIKLTEGDIHNIVKEIVQEALKEYGTPEQLGAIAARRTLRGKGDPKEVHKYASDKGVEKMPYYSGYVEYMKYHPNETNKYARDKFHKNKKGA